jgi:diacylglycerol kinase (ATP)
VGVKDVNSREATPEVDTDPRSSRTSRLLVVVNPATRRSARTIIAMLERLCPVDVLLDILVTPGPLTALDMTRSKLSGASGVVAVGGDGTVGEVASALVGTDVPLGIIPAGSTNIIAGELGIPRDPMRAIHLLFGAHETRHIDVVRGGERCFIHMAGAGIDSRMFALANPTAKRRFGWLAYIPAAGRAVFHPPARFTLDIDGDRQVIEAPLVLIANGGSIITPRFRLMPSLRADDGMLDVLIFNTTTVGGVAKILGSMLTRRSHLSRYVIHRSGRTVVLQSDPPLPVQLDGDVAASTPVTFEVLPAALRVIVPIRG